MQLLMNVPVVFKILVSLGVILVGNRLLKNLSLSVLAGILLLAFWSGQTLSSLFGITWIRFSEIDQIFLYLVIFLVIWLSSQMKETGSMDDLVTGVQSILTRRTSMAVLPALIGLLPMPGGAIFSAPLVDSCDQTGGTGALLKSRINYWFRHVWEYWWPLYPGVLLAVDLSGLGVGKFALLMFPVTFIFILAGYLFLLRKVPHEAATRREARKGGILISIVPILITMGVYILLLNLFPVLSVLSRYVPMIIGIIIAILVLQIRKPLAWKTWKKIIVNRKTFNLAVLVLLIRIYGAFIEAPLPEGILLMDQMREELSAWGIPLTLFIILIPFISGLATGIAIGTVGASFPIVMSLLGMNPEPGMLFSTVLLAYSCGHAGMMLSPVHVCLIVSSEYYETGVFKSIHGLIKPALFLVAGAFLLSRLLLVIF